MCECTCECTCERKQPTLSLRTNTCGLASLLADACSQSILLSPTNFFVIVGVSLNSVLVASVCCDPV